MESIFDLLGENKTAVSGLVAFLIGAGVRVYDRLLKKQSDDVVLSQQLRNELRTDLVEANRQIDALESEVSEWKKKYWDEVEAHSATKLDLRRQIEDLESLDDDDDQG